jgi:methylmalonyl-CoA mutase cobalamin-binding subunit
MTSASVKTRPQIFLSFAQSDRRLAEQVGSALHDAGLTVVQMDQLLARRAYDDTVRSALRESDAVVVALSSVSRRHEVPASVLFEIGAAVGAAKPIFVIVEEATAKLPFNAPQMEVLPVNRVNEIADRLSNGSTRT